MKDKENVDLHEVLFRPVPKFETDYWSEWAAIAGELLLGGIFLWHAHLGLTSKNTAPPSSAIKTPHTHSPILVAKHPAPL